MARVRGDREESSRKEERRTNMRLARCLASWLVHTSTSKGRGRGQGLTPYPPTLRVARHQAAYPLPPYPKCPDATLPYPPGVPNPEARGRDSTKYGKSRASTTNCYMYIHHVQRISMAAAIGEAAGIHKAIMITTCTGGYRRQ
jgi:hypothetical protein